MTIRRVSLYAGAFVLALGAVLLAASLGWLDRGGIVDTVNALWPVAVIAIGLALLLRRTPVAIPVGLAAATAPGLLLGGAIVAAPALPMPCLGGDLVSPTQTLHGPVAGSGSIALRLACGEVSVGTQPGSEWRFQSADGPGRHTNVTALASGFTADTASGGWTAGAGPVNWSATLPTNAPLDLTVEVGAGRGRLNLQGAQLGIATFSVDAGDLRADLANAALRRLALTVNAGSAVLTLPADGFAGTVTANAGSVRVCVPFGLGVRVQSSESLGRVRLANLVRSGDTWTSPGTTTPVATADLFVSASAGSVTISPEGGCK